MNRGFAIESFQEEIQQLNQWIEACSLLKTPEEKSHFLESELSLNAFPQIKSISLPSEKKYLLLVMVAVNQSDTINAMLATPEGQDYLSSFLDTLRIVESFYQPMGGILGYHKAFLELLQEDGVGEGANYSQPPALSLMEDTLETRRCVIQGIQSLPYLAEIYPVGGAGDRLNLIDESNGEPLPAARLPFNGRTLLCEMVRDLQSREYLYFKLFNEQLAVPVAMMTSQDKDNHNQIRKICEEENWYGRGEEQFFRFVQPLVPVITKEGKWAFNGPLDPVLKPGGHGVVWRLAVESGAFEWLYHKGVRKAIVRQINNPIASTDYPLLSFIGVGCNEDKAFGFCSCKRLIGTAEGVNVLVKKENRYALSNIEYTDFQKEGIQDVPDAPGSPYSAFPSNTNILFADLKAIEQEVARDPIPGKLINLKHDFPQYEPDGTYRQVKGGRLESMMQNVADRMYFQSDHIPKPDELPSFITFTPREKTISVTKNSYAPGNKFVETPEGCFYDIQKNMHTLFTQHCAFDLSSPPKEGEYLKGKLPYLIQTHPALGPLWDIVGQKIQRGKLAPGSELLLEIATLSLQDITLDGSLQVIATHPLGHLEGDKIRYSSRNGKCHMHRVVIENAGVDYTAQNTFWKGEVARKESLKIVIHGSGEFFAEDVTIKGGKTIEVPDGIRVVMDKEGRREEPLKEPSWDWEYEVDESSQRIALHR